MSEMPDVATLTTISRDWGNDIRDRTVQRYSSVANRSTLHGAPVEGDLSYLADSGSVDVFHSGSWQSIDTAASILAKLLTVDGAGSGLDADRLDGVSIGGLASFGQIMKPVVAENATALVLTGSFQNAAVQALAVPAWGSASLYLFGIATCDGTGDALFDLRLNVGGVAGTTRTFPAYGGGGVETSTGFCSWVAGITPNTTPNINLQILTLAGGGGTYRTGGFFGLLTRES